ncbi:MAG TPA: SDR family NAD(P)-dependent oxidoreductase [Candidatus Binataceae bacterium]|nr:SDR family NAD(P)-dependent oxidoreductase [Candidatus Binataceae bacterium]
MKYAIVTGGSRGIGLAIVRALLVEKVVEQVAVVDKALQPPPAEIADRVAGFAADVTDEAQVHSALEAVTARFGPHPGVLCNNAGGGEANWFESGQASEKDGAWHSVELWRRYVDLNLNSVYLVSKEAVPRMRSGAAICNTSSIAGMLATPGLAAYAAAKAGVISYTRSLALQLGASGIRVNAVAPGLIYTKIWEELGAALGGGPDRARATFEAAVHSLVPLGREQTPGDIGRTVAWLCSDRAANVTGQIIAIDGGITLGRPPLRSST